MHKVLDGLALSVHTAVMSHGDVHQLLAHLDLLRRDILWVTCPCIKLGNIVGLTLDPLEADGLLSVCRAVVKVTELHLIELLVPKEDLRRTQVGVDHIL